MNQSKESILLDSIVSNYGTYELSRSQAANILGISTATLDRLKASGLGPGYIKGPSPCVDKAVENITKDKGAKDVSSNATVIYPVTEIVKYLLRQTSETA